MSDPHSASYHVSLTLTASPILFDLLVIVLAAVCAASQRSYAYVYPSYCSYANGCRYFSASVFVMICPAVYCIETLLYTAIACGCASGMWIKTS